ncbi:arginyltransferase [Nitrosomonas mobilis]|uniref:Aspartate/glutamate leucyltransferase n=1 Tax=Nitrosomonas mobilis TaxID=51642 RepID=A0A1G5SBL2_9PROT|nr:arginyltransferase [Nitrosomonas mobilis]SCZ84593.1 putative arginyl-tRNA--protein transferase [Nitrosomonas mobilis]HNO74470.1 arginyltransferase [Nitrosomonas mobilis]
MDFHLTEYYPCSYLPDKSARSRIAVAHNSPESLVYARLIRQGYRRSGHFIYRPECDRCQSCLPVRIPVEQFCASRTQRRVWKQHQHLLAAWHPLHYNPAHLELYQRYQHARHTGGSMENDSHAQYCDFLLKSNVDSFLITFHENDQLRMISIIDQVPDGLSSVYTFFDPSVVNASYGTFNILWQIEQCLSRHLPYLYLGYWIAENRKMRYKSNFKPLQVFTGNQWQTMHLTARADNPDAL